MIGIKFYDSVEHLLLFEYETETPLTFMQGQEVVLDENQSDPEIKGTISRVEIQVDKNEASVDQVIHLYIERT